jgi:hypothetical protein
MLALGEVDLVLSVMYSALLLALLVLSYCSIWRRRDNTRD